MGICCIVIMPEFRLVEVEKMIELKMNGMELTLCHYPLLSWPHMHQGGYCIFGHIHNNNREESAWPFIRENPFLLNAGVDVNWYSPVLFSELQENNKLFKESSRSCKTTP